MHSFKSLYMSCGARDIFSGSFLITAANEYVWIDWKFPKTTTPTNEGRL